MLKGMELERGGQDSSSGLSHLLGIRTLLPPFLHTLLA